MCNSKALDHKDKIFKFLTAEEALIIKLGMAFWKIKQIPTTNALQQGNAKTFALCQADPKIRMLSEMEF